MSVEDEPPQAEEEHMAVRESKGTASPEQDLQSVQEESVRSEGSDDQRIHNTNGEGTGLVDEGVDGRGNRPHPRRRNLWVAVGTVAVVATSLVFLAGKVVRNGGEKRRRQRSICKGEAGPIQVASEEFTRETQEQDRQQVEQQVRQQVEQQVEQQVQERVADLEEEHRTKLENQNRMANFRTLVVGILAFIVAL